MSLNRSRVPQTPRMIVHFFSLRIRPISSEHGKRTWVKILQKPLFEVQLKVWRKETLVAIGGLPCGKGRNCASKVSDKGKREEAGKFPFSIMG